MGNMAGTKEEVELLGFENNCLHVRRKDGSEMLLQNCHLIGMDDLPEHDVNEPFTVTLHFDLSTPNPQ